LQAKVIDTAAHTFRSPEYSGVVSNAIDFLECTPIHELPPPGPFPGVGVYAIYYIGPCEYYRAIATANARSSKLPIYVGKAVPEGWRTARVLPAKSSQQLSHRLLEHARSIQQGSGIELADFRCRFVILGDAEVDLVTGIEAQMIRRYVPIWNSLVDGFGNHDPGSGRYNQAKSEWDVLHPGRRWADRLTGKPATLDDIMAKLKRSGNSTAS
jgi:hypothetical protein